MSFQKQKNHKHFAEDSLWLLTLFLATTIVKWFRLGR